VHRVLIADRHPVVQTGLRSLLSRDDRIEVCGVVSDAAGVRAALEGANPLDLVLLDLHLRNGATMNLVRGLLRTRPALRVMIIMQTDDPFWAERALRSGAHAVVLESEPADAILDAVRRVLRGERYVSDGLRRRIGRRYPWDGARPVPPVETLLTRREMEVFTLLGQGLDRQQVARRLHISPRSADRHCVSIRAKGCFDNNHDLTRYAMLWHAHRPSNH
jgi:DNA-binding NarL/FixJ family response regulator